MTRQELDLIFARLGLEIPEHARDDIIEVAHFIEEMKASVMRPRSLKAEPAHIVSFPE